MLNRVKELTEKQSKGRGLKLRSCCGKTPKIPTPCFNTEEVTTYQVFCKTCGTATAPYETMEDSIVAWQNKILL